MKICVITGSRADYGLLYCTLKALQKDPSIHLQICVTGMHLSPEYDLTYKQIEKDGFEIDYKVESLLSSDTSSGMSKTIGIGIIGFTDAFSKLRPNLILVLGDRIEIFSAVIAAMTRLIPIAHCHGGESTEGAIDEAIRHSITKMAHIHLVSTDDYKKRVIQLGENPSYVFNVGALGLENISDKILNKTQFEKSIIKKLHKVNFLITFHPETLENNIKQADVLLTALDKFQNALLIFTQSNSDTMGRLLNEKFLNYVKDNPKRSVFIKTLGTMRYFSALSHVDLIIGNSSSGIIEAPSFNTPTINIGDRQKGRVRSKSVIDCNTETELIVKAIKKGLSKDFLKNISKSKNPYLKKNSSFEIIKIIKSQFSKKVLKKEFFDLKFDYEIPK